MSTHRLTDADYLQFLHEGYVVVRPSSLDANFHQQMWDSANELYEQARKLESPTAHLDLLGDNLRARIPALDRLLTAPEVVGAVTSILGENACLHPHHFVHQSMAQDQPFHQDGNLPWNERGHYRSHRPDWLIFFYYPQDVTLDNGPTEIIPGSQYWTTDIEKPDGGWRRGDPIDHTLDPKILTSSDLSARDDALAASVDKLCIPDLERRFLEVPGGSVVIGNYDLIHRGTRTLPDQAPRYMFKFYYARTEEPTRPTWDARASLPDLAAVRDVLRPVVTANWNWGAGRRDRQRLDDRAVAHATDALFAGREHERVAAAYELGGDAKQQSLDTLLAALHDEAESTRRAAAYGLRLRCDEAAAPLLQACKDDRPSVRRFACFALGAYWSPGAEVLIDRIAEEPDDLARSNAAYALGQIARNPGANATKILAALMQRLQPGVEPDNTDVAALSRSTVRQSLGYAVLQLACNHRVAPEDRRVLTDLVRDEKDRYVAGMLVEALAQGSEDAELITALAARRWSAVVR